MKLIRNIIAVILVFSALTILNAQNERKTSTAVVDKINDVPVFVMAIPVADYEVVGKAANAGHLLKLGVNATATVYDKFKSVVETAKKRKEKGKLSDFDALLIDLDNDKVTAIKFKEKGDNNLKAEVIKFEGVPVYFFSKPLDKYEIVDELEADYSLYAARNLLTDKINSMLNRTIKKEKSGKVNKFDAVIISPKDLSETLIKFE